MASDNTSPRATTTTADAAESTQQFAPVPAPPEAEGTTSARASEHNGTASNGTASNGAGPAAAPGRSSTPDPAERSSSGAAEDQAATPVKDGAVKAAASALAAARNAARKVQSAASAASAGGTTEARARAAQSGSTASSTPPPPPAPDSTEPRPQMHYSAGGVYGTAQQVPLSAGQSGAAPQTGAQPMAAEPEQVAGARRVRLSVSRVDPWSVMKLAFLLSFAIGIMVVVATTVVWYSLNSLGTFGTIQEFLVETLGPQTMDITQFVALNRMLSLAMLVALVNMVLMTALATIMAIIYNITAALVGGVHLTLTDE